MGKAGDKGGVGVAVQRRRAGTERSWAGRPSGPPRQPRAGGPELGAQRARLRAIIGPVVTAAGYDLEGVTVRRIGRRHVLRVIVDGDQGVGLDAVAELSRAISAALDAAEATGGEVVNGEYELEVSSPGVDRPLTQPRHWRRSIGRLVRVTVADEAVEGRVTGADDDAVVLDVGGVPRLVPYPALGPGRVQVEFNRLADVSDDDLDEIVDEEGEDAE